MNQLFRKTSLMFFACAAIFLFADISIAQAEYTCCACELPGREESFFAGFACKVGSNNCHGVTGVCKTGEANIEISRRDQELWEYDGETYVRGSDVVCCRCADNTRRCESTTRTCQQICGEGNFIRGQNSIRAGSDDIEGTGDEPVDSTPTPTPAAPTEEERPIEIRKPNIEIPIPGFIGFSEVKVDGEEISIPWIAEYMVAIFNWLIAIVGAVATVMIMIGGFIYLTAAGSQERIGQATKMITNAVVGLLLALGSYLILYTIHPSLVEFKNIRLDIIGRKEIGFDEDTYNDSDNTMPLPPMVSREASSVSAATNFSGLMNSAGCGRNRGVSGPQAVEAFRRAAQAFLASTNAVNYVLGGVTDNSGCTRVTPANAEILSRVRELTNICYDCQTFTRSLFLCATGQYANFLQNSYHTPERRPYLNRYLGQAHSDAAKNTTLLAAYQDFRSTRSGGATGIAARGAGGGSDFASANEFWRQYQSGDIRLQEGDIVLNGCWTIATGDACTGHFVTYLGNGRTIEVTSGNHPLWKNGRLDESARGGAVRSNSLEGRINFLIRTENRLERLNPIVILRIINP